MHAVTVAASALTEIRGIYAEFWLESLLGLRGTVDITMGIKLDGRVSDLGRRNRFFFCIP
jgi:hypothetical protein